MSLPEDPTPKLQELQSSISHLSSVLDPVLSQKLSALSQQLESGSSQSANAPGNLSTGAAGASDRAATTRELAGRLDSARLNVSAAYVLLDLIWIYLRVNAQDPKTHEVTASLERVKNYFGKVAVAQRRLPRSSSSTVHSKGGASGVATGDTSEEGGLENLRAAGFGKEERRLPLDTVAAGRFVKAALDKADTLKTLKGNHTRFEDDIATSSSATKKSKKHRKSLDLNAGEAEPKRTGDAASDAQRADVDARRSLSSSARQSAMSSPSGADLSSEEAKAHRKALKKAEKLKKTKHR